jgi:hypothetical protein
VERLLRLAVEEVANGRQFILKGNGYEQQSGPPLSERELIDGLIVINRGVVTRIIDALNRSTQPVSESPENSGEGERTITINRHDFRVSGRTMAAADLYALPVPPLDPFAHDLYQETPGDSPDCWVDPRQVVNFDQGSRFFSAPRHINASAPQPDADPEVPRCGGTKRILVEPEPARADRAEESLRGLRGRFERGLGDPSEGLAEDAVDDVLRIFDEAADLTQPVPGNSGGVDEER